jgi:hypothetical protein
MVSRERRRIDGPRGFVVCDTRHFPIVVLQWYGQLDAELANGFGRWMDDLLQVLETEDLRMATLGDLTHADPPSGAGRRVLVELRAGHQQRSHGRVVTDVLVSNRPALRGATQTLGWLNPRAPAELVTTMDEGLRRCRAALQRVGVSSPSLRAEEFERPA